MVQMMGEGVEYIDDIQHRRHRQGRTHQRDRDLEQLLSVIGAVHGGSLVQGAVYTLQARQHREAYKGNGDKDTAGDFPGEESLRRGCPVDILLDDAKGFQKGVQRAVVLIDDKAPDTGLHDQRCGPGEHDNRTSNLYYSRLSPFVNK